MKTSQKKLTPQQRLREKLYPIKFSENIEGHKKRINWKEVIRLAREVRKTFKNEDIVQPRPTL